MPRLCAVLTLLAVAGYGCTRVAVPAQATLPQAPKLAGGLALLDASFASDIHDRAPARLSQTVSLSPEDDQDLSFWMELSCTGICEQRLAEGGRVTVFLDWYKESQGLLLKQASTPLAIKAAHWRTWGTKRVTPGKWVTVVRADDSWVCLQQQCHFSIEVQP